MTSPVPTLKPEEYATLVEQSPIMIWRARLDGLCDYFNRRWLDFTGRTMEQEFGNGWAEGVHAEDLQRCLDIYLDHFGRRQGFEMEYRLRRHDGAWRWILDKGSPSWTATGEFQGFIGSCVDVTDRIEAQAALAEALGKQIQTLQGLLPICMLCKRVKNHQGYWEGLEHYIRDNSSADFSHGLCPDCYPGYVSKIEADAAAWKKQR
jgi:PAS domain S-box-containing protein